MNFYKLLKVINFFCLNISNASFKVFQIYVNFNIKIIQIIHERWLRRFEVTERINGYTD